MSCYLSWYISGGMPQLIASCTGNGTSGTCTFSPIPGIYKDLILVISGRSDLAALNETIAITVNGLSTSIYDLQRLYVNSTTSTADEFLAQTSWGHGLPIAAASASSNWSGGGQIEILDYAGTTFHKLFLSRMRDPAAASSGSSYMFECSGMVRTTNAITSITCALGSGNYVTGTRIDLYGRGLR